MVISLYFLVPIVWHLQLQSPMMVLVGQTYPDDSFHTLPLQGYSAIETALANILCDADLHAYS